MPYLTRDSDLVPSGCVAALHAHCVVPAFGSRFVATGWVALLCEFAGSFHPVARRRVHSGPPGSLERYPSPRTVRMGWQRTVADALLLAVGSRFVAFRAVLAKPKHCSLAEMSRFMASGWVALPRTCWGMPC